MLAHLWIGKGVVAVAGMKAGIAGCIARLHATEESLERPVDPQRHVLQDLGIDLAVFGQRLFNAG
jgi:hypothetical protein